jgi:hypothetical protein
MGVADGGMRDQRAGTEEIVGRGDVVAGLVPEVGQAEERPVGEKDGEEEERKESPKQEARGLFSAWCYGVLVRRRGHALVDGAAALRQFGLERDGAEGLFVLGEVVAQEVEEGLSLLRAEIDALEVLDVELLGGVLVHGAKDEGEVPDAHPDLHAVGVAAAEVRGTGDLDFGLSGLCRGLIGIGRRSLAHRVISRSRVVL